MHTEKNEENAWCGEEKEAHAMAEGNNKGWKYSNDAKKKKTWAGDTIRGHDSKLDN